MRRDVSAELLVDRGITARLGPTNTGKTHHAIRRMLGYRSGMIGLPLRLLAREVYDRVVAEVGEDAVALVTGEEKRIPAGCRYWICTVESMPLDRPVSFVAVDEIQLATDRARGHVFTDRLLRARGRVETWFMGSSSMASILRDIVPEAKIVQQPRLSQLSYAGPCRLRKLPKRTAVVAFSAGDVYDLAERLRGRHGGVAVVMGALSPRARNAQVAMYQAGEVPYLVATDAIGMGLNMDVHHVALASTHKFDGRTHRPLRPEEVAQIAGRAGRWKRDGSFGETGGCPLLEDEVVEAVVQHRFPSVRWIWWRNATDLSFDDVSSLLASLAQAPPRADRLRRAEDGDDVAALRRLAQMPDVIAIADRPDRLRLLWDVCGVPDFGNVLPEHHANLLSWLYRRLMAREHGLSDADMAEQVDRLDRIDGDAPTLMARLAGIRTWSFVTHRAGWVNDAAAWRARVDHVEERLSGSLHTALTERFVDRRGRAWSRALARGHLPAPTVDEDGLVRTVDEVLGTLRGVRFVPATGGKGESPATHQAIRAVVMPLLRARLEALVADPGQLTLAADGAVQWEGATVGGLHPGRDWREPRVKPAQTPWIEGDDRGRLAAALEAWRLVWFAQRVAPASRIQIDGAAARGLREVLIQHLGVVPRREVGDQVDRLSAEARRALHRQGVRIGRRWIWHAGMAPRIEERHLLLRIFSRDIPDLPSHGGVEPFQGRWSGRMADRLGITRYRGGWLRSDVAEAAWRDPRTAELVFRLPVGRLSASMEDV